MLIVELMYNTNIDAEFFGLPMFFGGHRKLTKINVDPTRVNLQALGAIQNFLIVLVGRCKHNFILALSSSLLQQRHLLILRSPLFISPPS